MSKTTILSAFLAASLAGNASFLVSALTSTHAPAGAIAELALTAGQAKELEASKKTFQEERAKAHRGMTELRGALAEEFAQESPDRAKLLRTSLEMAELQTAMRPKLVDHILVLHAVLTPDQRAAFARLMRSGGGMAAGCPGAMLYSTPTEDK
jgi:uncharacterized membrane protein